MGDVRHGSIKRVASAVGEGAIAVQFIHRYMAKVSPMSNVTREELRTVEVFHDLPDEQLDWFLEHSTRSASSPARFMFARGTLRTR